LVFISGIAPNETSLFLKFKLLGLHVVTKY